jgi:hypothetical protein
VALGLALALALAAAGGTAADPGGSGREPGQRPERPYESPPGEVPLDGPHRYRVTWLGVHCGDMTLESAAVEGKPSLVRMVMTVASTELFDGIYRVRSRIESIYNVRLASTRRYQEETSEKDRTKEDLWLVDSRAGEARRTRNGKVETYELPPGGAHDPLAMLYRFRALAREAGDVATIPVMTTRGAVEARAVAERWEQYDGSWGEVRALKVVQQPVGDEAFGRGGAVTMWLSSDEERVPYRIEFDLPFGKLVAELDPAG